VDLNFLDGKMGIMVYGFVVFIQGISFVFVHTFLVGLGTES
jgi:hypothetical protein